jgi:chromate transporter
LKKNLVLLKAYLIAGTFTFSGGMAMLPVIERELVTKHHFLSKEELFESSLISQTLPGVIALTNACFVKLTVLWG